MQQEAVYELLVAKPHEPADARLSAAEFVHYRDGYSWALVMALRVMEAATRRYELVARTKRIDAARRRKEANANRSSSVGENPAATRGR